MDAFALSIRQTLSSPYKDEAPKINAEGGWTYRYFQENQDISSRDAEYTNRGLIECMRAKVPIGVLRQIAPKPHSQYHILGLGLVKHWEKGFFFVEGLTPMKLGL